MLMPYVVICAREAPEFGPEAALALYRQYIPLLLESIKEEPEVDVLVVLLMSLKVRNRFTCVIAF